MRLTAALAALVMLAAGALSAAPAAPKDTKPQTGRWVVVETNKGTIKFALYEKDAPITTRNFIELANRKFYDGLTFHRVEDWVAQGGDPTGTGMGGSEKTIKLETKPNLTFDEPYVVGMARSQDPDSASSQFYITKKPAPWLNGGYAAFGIVMAGQSVVDKLEKGDVMKTVRIVPAPKPKPKAAAPKKPSGTKTKKK